MTRTIHFILVAFLFLMPGQVLAQAKSFSHTGIARDAQRYEAWIKANVRPGAHRVPDLVAAARKAAAGGDQRAASQAYSMAVLVDPDNANLWIDLATALLATTPDPKRSSERYDLPVSASGAAYRAYERASNPGTKARALAVLGEAL